MGAADGGSGHSTVGWIDRSSDSFAERQAMVARYFPAGPTTPPNRLAFVTLLASPGSNPGSEQADELEDQLIDVRQVTLPCVSDSYTIQVSRQNGLPVRGHHENGAI